MTMLTLDLDPRSPVPLYHQIAEALRYRIATGVLPLGTVLPPLREAARLWRVNLHTVRRAYQALSEEGVVATRVPHGTVVQPGAVAPAPADQRPSDTRRARGERGDARSARATGEKAGRSTETRDAFFSRVKKEANDAHGLTLAALLEGLATLSRPAAARADGAVYVAECSLSQSADLAAQLEARWRVRATPWPIDRPEPPSSAAIVATLFHYNDLRTRWPERFASVRFLAIAPDRALARKLRSPHAGQPIRAVICEREEAMLRNMAADLARLLPAARFRLETRLVSRPARLLERARAGQTLLVSPRLWSELPDAARRDPRVHEVRYVFDALSLDRLGLELGWKSREEKE